MREIHLDGGEVSMVKAIGVGGTTVSGDQLIERVTGLQEAEFIETLQGLIVMGYVVGDRQSFRTFDDVRNSTFHVNSGYAKALREAVDPRARPEKKSRRV